MPGSLMLRMVDIANLAVRHLPIHYKSGLNRLCASFD